MSASKVSIFLAATALLVSVLFATPLGQAASNFVLAKNSVGSAQVRNGSLQKVDLSKKAVAALHGARGAQGIQGIQGAQGAQGAQGIQGIQGVAGTARAYGLVTGTTVTRSKNITGVTNPNPGFFCITLAAGIGPATTGAVVTPDFFNDETHSGSFAQQAITEWNSSASACPAGTLEVQTFRRVVSSAADPQGGATFVTDVSIVPANEGFFIAVP